jgi:hypothetical protein
LFIRVFLCQYVGSGGFKESQAVVEVEAIIAARPAVYTAMVYDTCIHAAQADRPVAHRTRDTRPVRYSL